MIARTLPVMTADDAARAIRALGSHRYVGGQLHLVHAFVFAALDDLDVPDVSEACAWARGVLSDETIDPGSRDERLLRHATAREVAAAIAVFWSNGETADRARAALEARLSAIDVHLPSDVPFDEAAEEDMFPVLIDAGFELLALGALDPERHRGVIDAFVSDLGDPLGFEAAKFEEQALADAQDEGAAYLQELSAMGPTELLRASHDGVLTAPFVVWTDGPETYHEYILRGVVRAAKLAER